MSTRIVVAVDSSLPADVQESTRAACTDLANYIGDIVLFASLEADVVDDLRA